MFKKPFFYRLVWLWLLLSSPLLHAGVVTVNSTSSATIANDGLCTLPEVVNNINNASTLSGEDCVDWLVDSSYIIQLPTGTFNLTVPINFTSTAPFDAVTLQGGSDVASETVIDGSAVSTSLISTLTKNLTLNNLSLVNATGLAIKVSSANLFANNVRILNNGTGIEGSGSSNEVLIENSTISNNGSASASDGAGARFSSMGRVVLNNNSVQNNESGGNGGGLFLTAIEEIKLTGNTLTGNRAQRGAGAYLFSNSGNITLDNNILTGNSAQSGAGASFVSNNAVTLQNNTLQNNVATDGGALHFSAVDAITLDGNRISNNSASTQGGGVYISHSSPFSLQLQNNRVLANTTTNGAALYLELASAIGVSLGSNNCFVGNTPLSVEGGTSSIGGGSNWWGRPDGPSGAFSGTGDSVAAVEVTTFLDTPPFSDCPTLPEPVFSCDTVSIPAEQCLALVELYNATEGDNWKVNTDWLSPSVDICTWHGLSCSTTSSGLATIAMIGLSGHNLVGELPDLSALTTLSVFDVSGNALHGALPDLSSASGLSSFNIAGNQFEGVVSTWLTQLTNLRTVGLRYNKLSPASATQLATLNGLDSQWLATQTLPPSVLDAAEIGETQVLLKWEPIDYQTDGGYYAIERATSASGPFTEVVRTDNKAASTILVSNLQGNTTYYFQIRTFTPAHSENDNALLSQPSAVLEVTTVNTNVASSPSPGTSFDFGPTPVDTVSAVIHQVQLRYLETAVSEIAADVIGTHAQDFIAEVMASVSDPTAGQATTTINVQCQPSAEGLRNASLTVTVIVNNGTAKNFSYPLVCEGSAETQLPQVQLNPVANTLLDLGASVVGTPSTAQQAITLLDVGTVPITEVIANITGSHASDFSNTISGPTGTDNHLFRIDLRCVPLAAGVRNATVTVITVPSTGNFTYPLVCTGLQENQAPTAINLSHQTIPADSPNGSSVGQFSTVDPDVGDSHVYTLLNDAGGRFALQNDTLIIANAALLVPDTTYEMTVRSTDTGNLSLQHNFTLTVAPLGNRPPTAIALDNNTVAVVGIDPTPLLDIGQLSTTDPNPGDTHTYTLVSDDSGFFVLQDALLQLRAGLRFEADSSHNIVIRSTDNTGLFIEQAFTINIRLSNSNPLIRGEIRTDTASGVVLSINAPEAATLLGFINPPPEQIGRTAIPLVRLSWLGHNATTPLALAFELPPQTLITQNQFIIYSGYFFGLTGRFNLDIGYRLPDEPDTAEFILENAMTLTVTPNRSPNNLSLSSDTVPEDAEPGTVIGVLSAEDPDRADHFQFGLVDTAEQRFRIVGDELQVNYGALFNSNRNATHDITVRVTDAYGGFVEREFTIEVLAVASVNGPQRILLNKNRVKENAPAGTVIGRFLTVSRYNKWYQYRLLDDAESRFALVDDVLLVADSEGLDYETDTAHEIEVESMDPESNQAIRERFTIELQNQPDVSSQFNALPAAVPPSPPALSTEQDTPSSASLPSRRLLLQWQTEHAHIGEQAKVFILFADMALSDIFTLTPDGEWVAWDGVISSLQSYTEVTLKKQHRLVLNVADMAAATDIEAGQLFFAYQLLDGDLLYQPFGEPLSALQVAEE